MGHRLPLTKDTSWCTHAFPLLSEDIHASLRAAGTNTKAWDTPGLHSATHPWWPTSLYVKTKNKTKQLFFSWGIIKSELVYIQKENQPVNLHFIQTLCLRFGARATLRIQLQLLNFNFLSHVFENTIIIQSGNPESFIYQRQILGVILSQSWRNKEVPCV